jgi:hypothetical protein
MGDCVSTYRKMQKGAVQLSGNMAVPSQLKLRDLESFLGEVSKHPLLRARFKVTDPIRRKYLASQIRIVLNYAFKYDRIYPWRELFNIHRGMAITKSEMTTFNDIFFKVCFSKKLSAFSVERRVMERIGKLIVDEKAVTVLPNDVLFIYRSIKKNIILSRKFEDIAPCQVYRVLEQLMFLILSGGSPKEFSKYAKSHDHLNITGAEFDEFTKLYLQIHHSNVEFIEKSKPVFVKLRSLMVIDKTKNMLKLYQEMKNSYVMGKHFQLLQFQSLKKMVNTILDFVKDPNYLHRMDEFVHLHKDLSIGGAEIDEFERLFLKTRFNHEEKFDLKFKEVLAHFKQRLLVYPIRKKNIID